MIPVIHAITPGDHFSAKTGSAIPSVVHGLASAARNEAAPMFAHSVLLERGTYSPRYDSAAAIEYTGVAAPSRNERVLDVGLGLLGRPRQAAIRYWQPAVDAVAAREPSIVLAHNAPVLPWMLRDTEHRVVLYAHNDILRTLTKYEAARSLDTVASIVSVSESLAAQLARRLPRRLVDRIAVVGNGVDCAQFSPSAETERSPVRVILVARMIPQKGADVLLRAAALLGRSDVEFVLVGSHGFDPNAPLSRYERRLRELASRCRVPVTFSPFVPRAEVAELFRHADIMVVPSRWQEPSGLTVGEALASGLPVIASRVGGIPEVLGSAGVLVERERPAELAREIERLLDDPSRRRVLGAEARRQAETHDWAWSWSILESVLSGVLPRGEYSR